MMNINKRGIVLILLLIACTFVSAQKREILLHDEWHAKRASEIPLDGTVISMADFEPVGWIEATVPGTVLTSLLNNKVFPDPFFGMNNELIPDIYAVGAEYYTFWFRKEFSVTPLNENQRVWLNFRGINYSADVFLNGRRISHDTHAGMFMRQKYLVTPYLNNNEPNVLAVIVHPPDPVGEANGGQGGDGTIARSVTQQYTPGWDWVCPVRDRNTGIWDQVSLEITGTVDLRNPHIKTRVPGKRIPGNDQQPAYLDVSAELYNATDTVQKGTFVAEFGGKQYSVQVALAPDEMRTVSLPEIVVKQPKLWWPNGMGPAHLHHVQLSFLQNELISDAETVQIGIRENSTYFDEKTGARVFLVNGQKVFIKGGNWISSDLLLRHSPQRYEAEVRMHAEMNMNMIRIWGGSITERPDFYDACDKYGLLVWQDLWVTGDCNGRWFDPRKKESQARRQAYPDNHSLFINSVIDQVKMLRNHPSLYLWCGGNEFPPPADINELLEKTIFPAYDGTRYYLNESTSAELARNTIGGPGDGPYGLQNPARFFNTPSYPFNPEIGSVGMPNVEAMRKMMAEEDLTPPVNDRPNRVWQYHKYIGYNQSIDNFGEIEGIDDFCKKAQVINYEQYRALQEGFNAGMWSVYTGMLVWKNQNPWTSLRGQFYDVYLDQTGGFYGYMQGAKPLHIQLNLNDSSICVVNQTLFDAENFTAEANLYDLEGNLLNKQQLQLNVPANSSKTTNKADVSKKPAGFCFLRLLLKNESGETVDQNLYWLTSRPEDYKDLSKLEPASLQMETELSKNGISMLKIKNTGNETAFFIRIKMVDEETKEIMLPVYVEDNYLTLFPGEERELEYDLSHLPVKHKQNKIVLQAEAFNGGSIAIPAN